jgi:hypothetical protein
MPTFLDPIQIGAIGAANRVVAANFRNKWCATQS